MSPTTHSPEQCPLCGQIPSTPFLSKNGYAIARCAHCELLHVKPTPSEEKLRTHYQNPAYFTGEEEQGYRSYADMRRALLPHFRRRVQMLDRQLPARGRLLDFGCAAGYFLEVARADGWQVAGVELSESMSQTASQALRIPIATSLERLPEKDFDAITLWEVVEHLPRPLQTLNDLRERLRPGGGLMLSTPNTGHWQAIRESEAWVGYRPPSHLLFFTQATLTEVLRRAGFTAIHIAKVSPLPPLPGWLRRLSAPLQHGLTRGQTKAWSLALWTWRAIRVLGWGWQRVAHPADDIFTTLEALAFRPV